MIEQLTSYLDDFLIVAVVLAAALFLSVGVRRLVRRSLLKFAPGVAGFFGTVAQILVVLAGLFAAVWFAGVSGAVLLTVIAIISAGVSLALDHSAQDAIAGIKILVFGYVKAGDHVLLLGAHDGEVMATDLFTVTLRTRERNAVIIPNREVIGSVVVNKTMITGQAVDVVMPLRRPYSRSLAARIMIEVAHQIDEDYGDQIFDPEVKMTDITDVDQWRVRVYVSDDMSLSTARHALVYALATELERVGVQLGPALDVVLGDGEVAEWPRGGMSEAVSSLASDGLLPSTMGGT